MDWAAAPALCSSINPLVFLGPLLGTEAQKGVRAGPSLSIHPWIHLQMWPNASIEPQPSSITVHTQKKPLSVMPWGRLWCIGDGVEDGEQSCSVGPSITLGAQSCGLCGEERRFWRSWWGGRYPAKHQGELKAGAVGVLFPLFPCLFSPFGSLCS